MIQDRFEQLNAIAHQATNPVVFTQQLLIVPPVCKEILSRSSYVTVYIYIYMHAFKILLLLLA